jgi:hypothetical protein
MAIPALKSIEYDDDELYDREQAAKGMEGNVSSYPLGMQFRLCQTDLEKLEAEGSKPGATLRFAAMGEVTSVFRNKDGCRIELEISEFAGTDGKFFDLDEPTHICMCGPELEKIELEDDCERGDMIHLIGEARLESTADSEFMPGANFQITALTFEDESEESRSEGG